MTIQSTWRAQLREAIEGQYQVTITYMKVDRHKGMDRTRLVQRTIRPYELSKNRYGRPVCWATDSQHGARQIHSFRMDRIRGVKKAQHPKHFEHAVSITKHLRSFTDDE